MSKLNFIDLTKTEKKELIGAFNVNGTNDIFAAKYGVSTRTIQKWKATLVAEAGLNKKRLSKKNNKASSKKDSLETKDTLKVVKETIEEKYDILSHDKRAIKRLENENKILRKSISDAREDIVSSDDVKQLIAEAKEIGFQTETPKWLLEKSTSEMIPVCCLSDIHIGEVVKASEMGIGSDFNTETAQKYADKVVADFIKICKVNMANYSYKGIVCILGGDIITGSLHDLSDSNDRSPVQQVVEATNLIIRCVSALAEEFGNVFVPAVTGNHGRYDSRNYTKTKGRVDNSLETIVYHFVSQHFDNNDKVTIVTNQTDQIQFAINGRRFQLEHGDTIKGGAGIGGILVPIHRARAKKLGVAVAMKKPFDTLIIGHFHQHHISSELILMNSLKCYDEYSKAMGFGFSLPGMTSFFVNSNGDIIFATDIQIRDKELSQKNTKTKSIELF